MRLAENVQWRMKQTCFAGALIVNVIIGGKMRQCDSASLSHPFFSSLCVFSSALWAHTHTLSGLSTDSAERQGGICGHVESRHHNGRWPILCLYILHTLKGKRC